MLRRVLRLVPPPNRLSIYTPRQVRHFIVNNAVAPQIGPQNDYDYDKKGEDDPPKSGKGGGGPSGFRTSIESMLATFAGVALLAGTGAAYHYWYKWEVLRKMERAFTKGFDPALELALASKFETDGTIKKGRIRRKEQDYIDQIMNGEGESARSQFEFLER
jgi:hypothetical protein